MAQPQRKRHTFVPCDDITFSKEEILNDIRSGIIEVLNGDYGIPADEFLNRLRREKKQQNILPDGEQDETI